MKRILVVEDNASSLKLLTDILTFWGYTVLGAGDGVEGIRLTRAERPDLIMMDVQMPVMDGLTAIKELRRDEATRDIPIICVTSDTMRSSREKVLSMGGSDFISKPIDITEVRNMVRKHLKEEQKD